MTDARRAQLLTVLGTALAVLAGLMRGIEVQLLWQLLVLGVAAATLLAARRLHRRGLQRSAGQHSSRLL